MRPANPLEVGFEDEARVGQQGTYDAVWNEIGSRPTVARDERHDSSLDVQFCATVR
jgi:hypothetical protein